MPREPIHPGEFLTDELKQGPFAASVRGLDGLPAARKLLEILHEGWDSPLLTRRAKALAGAFERAEQS